VARHRALTIALICVVAFGALAFAADASTIRLSPGFSSLHPESRTAFSGELIEVKLGPLFTEPRTSDPGVVEALGGGYFIAAKPGRATLSAVTIRFPGMEAATYLWRVDLEVRLPGI
jgi:hypothetical protein